MQITVNGQATDVPEGTTVAQLLERLGVVPERVVVEMNLAIVKRERRAAAVLQSEDVVEIVQFVGGGACVVPFAD